MKIETIQIAEDVKPYLYFGWQFTQDVEVRYGRTSRTEHVLARDKDMQNYRLIAALEKKYFSLKAQQKRYEPMDAFTVFVLFLLLILPGLIYVSFKLWQSDKIIQHNGALHREMRKIAEEAKPLL